MGLVPAFWQFNHKLHNKDPSSRFSGSTTRLLDELKHPPPSPKYPHDGMGRFERGKWKMSCVWR